MSDKNHKRSWKNLLLDARYQLRFTLFMVAVSAVLMSGLGFFAMTRARSATKIGIQHVQGNPELFGDPDAEIEHLNARERFLGKSLAAIGVALSAGLFAYGIKMTHRVAGPIYKMTLIMDAVRDGKLSNELTPLRRGDNLVEFYEHFQSAHAAIRRGQEEDVAVLRALLAAAEKQGLASRSAELAARLRELETLAARKEATLG